MSANTVLILEDETMIAETLRQDLEGLGLRVLGPAHNCSAALELLWSQRPDLAVLDTQLGTETCEVVLDECRQQGIPVVIFSGHGSTELPAYARGLSTLSKPYLPEHLSQMIAAYD